MSNPFQKLIDDAAVHVSHLEKRYHLAVELENRISERFSKNIEAFRHYMPHVLEDFEKFEFDHSLLFMTDTGELNIFHPELKTPLYGDDPIQASKDQFATYETDPQFTRIRYGIEQNPRDQLQTQYLNRIVEVTVEAQNTLSPLKTLPDYVPNLLVYGIGLGYHLFDLITRLQSNHYYLYEPVPAFFWGSLFVFDWQAFFEKVDEKKLTLNINVGSDPQQFPRDYVSQLDLNGRYSASKTFLYLHYQSEELKKAVQALHESYNKQINGWGFFDDGVLSVGHGLTNLENKVPILRHVKKVPAENFLKLVDIPVFIVGNGPSLDSCLDIIREYRDRVILISCGTTITTLYRIGIKPDIQVDVERTKHSADKFDYLPESYLKDILALSVNVMHPKYFKYFDKCGYGMKPGETMSSLFTDELDQNSDYAYLQACNPLVGNLALSYAYYFGFRNVYLMGVDCGYIKGGLHHAKDSIYFGKGSDKVQLINNYVNADGVDVEGNFGAKVFSSHLMDYSRYMVNVLMREVAKNKRAYFYNCSNGVKFENIIPLKPDDVFLLDPPINQDELKSYIHETFFKAPPEFEGTIDQVAGKVEFANKVSELKDIINNAELENRGDFATLAKAMTDYVIQYRKAVKGKSYIYYLLIGSLNTFNAMMLTVVYDYQEEEQVIGLGKRMLGIWLEYLDAMVERYNNVVGWHDNYDWDGMKLFEQNSEEAEQDDD